VVYVVDIALVGLLEHPKDVGNAISWAVKPSLYFTNGWAVEIVTWNADYSLGSAKRFSCWGLWQVRRM